MKKISKKILAVLGSGIILGMGVQAQNPAISTFPYVADFGTTENAGPDNAYWQFKAFDMANDYSVINSEQWGFSTFSTDKQAVCLNKTENMEDQAAAFSPQFHMEKKSNVRYTVSVNFSVEDDALFPKETLVVRLHTADASGDPYFFNEGSVYYDSEEPIKEGDVIKSTFLYNHNGVPRTGSSTYTYSISSDKIPTEGNYRVSFIIVHKNSKKNAVKANAKLYITAFELKKEVGVDLAAGQILSPYTDGQAAAQPFSAYVINNTSVDVEGFSATYQIDDNAPVTQQFSNKLAAEKPYRISFSKFPDVSAGDHRVRFWVDNENDTEHGNDTSVVYIKAGVSAVSGVPVYYNFTEALPYGWTMRSDSDYVDPQWHFVKQGNNNCPYINTDKSSGRVNNDYLVTQPMSFKTGLMYRIEFTYRAVLESGSAMGDLSMALYVCQNASEASVASRQNLIWKKDRFDDRGDRRVVVYFRALEDANRVLAFHAYGPSAEGGLLLKNLSVYQDEPNRLDYFFDFDGNSKEDPQYLVEKNMDFVDNDGNVSTKGKTENWALWGENSGYNSVYSVRSQGTAAKTGANHSVSDDWMIYRPFYLEKGKPYYLKFFTKMSSNHGGLLEYYVQGNGIRYDLDYSLQPGVKGRKMVSSNYDTVHRVFEVEADGYYLLAIRNVTEVPEIDDNIALTGYTVYVDNVSLSSIEKSSAQAMEANVPFEARLGKTVSLSMTVRNFSLNSIEPDKISYCYQVGDGAVCREHPGYALLAQVKVTHTFNKQAAFDRENTQTVKFWVEVEGADEKQDTIVVRVEKIKVRDLPFVDKFGESSMSEWQAYPASRNIWQMQYGENTAHSGAWAAKCDGGNMAVSDFLVSPLLNVEKGKTYRISFFYKRAGETGGLGDSISLYYAYNRYDNTGFRNKIDVFRQITSTEYDYIETFAHFPDSGAVFIGLKADLAERTPLLYVDDFIVVDSMQTTLTYYTLSNLVVSGNMSECDTIPVGRVSFKVTAGGFSMPSSIPAYIRYDNGSVQDVSIHREMMDGEQAQLSFDMPMFSGGQHKVTAWIALADEADRSDDTLSVAFNVHEPFPVPFVETEMNIVGAPRMTDCFVVDSVGTYKIRYVYNAAEAGGSSLQVSLSRYGQNSITQAIPVENTSVSGTQAREKEIDIKETGVYAISFACADLSTGGILRIDSVYIGKKAVEPNRDTTANRGFGPQEFRLQPNPATDFVEVVLPADARTLTVFDIQGRICRRFVLQGQDKIRLSLQDFSPGVYVVGVAGNNRYGTRKLIRQ